MTPAGKIDILAAMIKLGTLFVDDMGMLLMVVRKASQANDPNEDTYWECDSVLDGDGRILWYKTHDVLAGMIYLDRMLKHGRH